MILYKQASFIVNLLLLDSRIQKSIKTGGGVFNKNSFLAHKSSYLPLTELVTHA